MIYHITSGDKIMVDFQISFIGFINLKMGF